MASLDHMVVTVTGVDRAAQVLLCRDALGNEFEVSMVRAKGVGMPEVDEKWLVTRKGRRWQPDVQMDAGKIPIITGSRDGLHPVSGQILDAMARQGLVFDDTIGC